MVVRTKMLGECFFLRFFIFEIETPKDETLVETPFPFLGRVIQILKVLEA